MTGSVRELQNVILEMIARGEPLSDTGDRLCMLAEQLVPGVTCSILRVQAGKLRPLSAPTLPKSYSQALDGVSIGPNVGSCGSAASLGIPVIVDDIATDPRWAEYKALALPLGLRACWSTPVSGLNQQIIATFAFYFNEVREPLPREREIIAACVHLCSIALDRHERVMDRERKAYFDMLTDLRNRASFVNALSLLPCETKGGWALLLLDVDNLKTVNDTFGHQAGDDLLRIVSARLAEAVAPHITYRLGGDEFAAIIVGDEVSDIDNISRRVLGELARPASCDGRSVLPAATIGTATLSDEDERADKVRRNADIALYHAKENQRGGAVHYNPALSSTMVSRANAIRDVSLALDDFRIDAYYQPIVKLDSRQIVGVEALCRIVKSSGEVVPAAAFHEATSDARIATELTRRMMGIAASDVRNWLKAGIPFQHVNINVTTPDFHGGRLEENLCATFGSEGVSLDHVVLEVTESVYMHRQDQLAKRAIESIRSKGAIVALDDFGTGYASLTDLLTVPVDILKIDKSFVDRLPEGQASAAIIEALIGIAKKLGMGVVAEGVEREEQATQLARFGCVHAQGYLFSKAVHRDEAKALLLRSAQPLADILRSVDTRYRPAPSVNALRAAH